MLNNNTNNHTLQQSESAPHESLPSINFHERQIEHYIINSDAPNNPSTDSLNINSESLRESEQSGAGE